MLLALEPWEWFCKQTAAPCLSRLLPLQRQNFLPRVFSLLYTCQRRLFTPGKGCRRRRKACNRLCVGNGPFAELVPELKDVLYLISPELLFRWTFEYVNWLRRRTKCLESLEEGACGLSRDLRATASSPQRIGQRISCPPRFRERVRPVALPLTRGKLTPHADIGKLKVSAAKGKPSNIGSSSLAILYSRGKLEYKL